MTASIWKAICREYGRRFQFFLPSFLQFQRLQACLLRLRNWILRIVKPHIVEHAFDEYERTNEAMAQNLAVLLSLFQEEKCL